MHHDVDAEREGPLIDRAGKGVVDDRGDAARPARRRHRGDVDAAQRRVDRRLEPDHLRGRRQDRLRLTELVDRHEARADAELRQQVGDEVQGAAVNRAAAHDFVAGGEEREERGRRRRLSAREHERARGALEPGNLGFDRQDGRVGVAGVEKLRRSPFVVIAHLLRVLEHERRRFVDGRRQRRGIVADAIGDVNELSGWFHDDVWPTLVYSEGLRPSDSPTRALARRFVGALRSRGSLAAARSHGSEIACTVPDAADARPIQRWTASSRSPLAATTGSMNWR